MRAKIVKAHSLTSQAALLLIAKTLAFALNFSLPLILIRRLSQHEFGLYKQTFLIVATAIATLPIGFGMSAFYFLPRESERRAQVVFNILVFYMVIGAIACAVLVTYPRSLVAILNSSDLLDYGPLIGVVILLWVLSSFLETVVI